MGIFSPMAYSEGYSSSNVVTSVTVGDANIAPHSWELLLHALGVGVGRMGEGGGCCFLSGLWL